MQSSSTYFLSKDFSFFVFLQSACIWLAACVLLLVREKMMISYAQILALDARLSYYLQDVEFSR